MEEFDIIVIGGGAAGFFGALAAAAQNRTARVVILERGKQPLAKVKISGGGRCNVTHACFDPAELVGYYPRGEKELRGAFSRFQPGDTVEWFESRGIKLKTEADGRMFPVTDDSQTIIDCLMKEAAKRRVSVRSNSGARTVRRDKAGYRVATTKGEMTASKVLLAPGGASDTAYRMASGLGHSIVPPVPSLFTFEISDDRIRELPGISVPHSSLVLQAGGESLTSSGPLLVTHWGLSGPAVLKLSAWGARLLAQSGYRADLQVNWLPALGRDEIFGELKSYRDAHPKQTVLKNNPLRQIPARLWESLVVYSGVAATQVWGESSNQLLQKITDELAAGQYQVRGKGVFKEEFVTCGGVALNEIDFKTMQSKLAAGVFLAGEILDIDGLTGGFNFQSAWTTGWLAGQAMGAR